MARTVLLDADTQVYAACRSAETPTEWHPGFWTLHSEFSDARDHFERDVALIREKLQPDEIVMALSDYERPWRREVMPTYKSQRNDVRKPLCYQPLRDYIHENYPTYQRPGLEGDDCLGVLCTNSKLYPGEKVVVSIDKDLRTVPGLHVNLNRALSDDDWSIESIEEHVANFYHCRQTLTGDTTDGYPGCPGVGPVKADKILNAPWPKGEMGEGFDVATAWTAIVAAYVKAGLTEADALQNARVARILRHGDYDYVNKEVKLWTPPQSTL